MTQRHKIFPSFHHENDGGYKKVLELRFQNKFKILISGGVQLGDIGDVKTETIRRIIRDDYLRDTSVTIVLIGTQTWQRKYVDWEISSSIRKTELNPRSGLLGLFLRSHPDSCDDYDYRTIPPRLHDNVECGYAVLADWTEDPDELQALIHEAYLRKSRIDPDNGRDLFRNNRSGAGWS